MQSKAMWFHPILYFVMVISLFCIGLGYDSAQLKEISACVIWMVFLLTSLTTIETFMRKEQEEGLFEQWVLSPYPLWWLMSAKALAIWLLSCLPLLLITPLMGLAMQLSFVEIQALMMSLLLGSPALTWIGTAGAALTMALPRTGVFLSLLLLPLLVPILILGQSAVPATQLTPLPLFQFAFLAGISLLAITLAPHASAAAIKVAMDE